MTNIPGTDLPAKGATNWFAPFKSAWDALRGKVAEHEDAVASILLPILESVPLYREGDSYDDGTQGADQASRPFARLASRLNMGAVTKTSVAGTRMDQIAGRLIASYPSNRRGMVSIGGGVLNDVFQYADDAGKTTTREALRSALAWITSRAFLAPNATALMFGPNWTNGSSSTAGAYVDVPFTAAEAYLQIGFVTGSGGTAKVYDAGALVATVSTGGFKNAFMGSVRLSGSAGAAKTYRVVVDSGSVTIGGLIVKSPTPPLVVWDQPGRLGRSAAEDARIAAYVAEASTILGQFPEVIAVGMGPLWDPATMISPEDNIHRNDRGNIHALKMILSALRSLPATPYQGLNRMVAVNSATPYVGPTTPAYVAPGASAPSAPSAPTVTPLDTTALVTWNRPIDGGSTITGWSLQYRASGASTWTTHPGTILATATSATLTGLTASSAYEARVAAINPTGMGAYSAVTAFSTTAALVTYFQDSFTRADASTPGSAPAGAAASLAWVVAGPTSTSAAAAAYGITSNKLRCTAVNGAAGGADCYIDTGAANGTVQAIAGETASGIAFRLALSSGYTATGYIFWRSGATYTLSRRSGQNYTQLGVSSGITPVPGDVLKVVMNGGSIKCYVNGALVIDVTDATVTGTKHGVWSQAGANFDDVLATDAVA